MVQPEKRLLWHPRKENKFVVGGGSQITLYEWAPEHPEIRQVTSQQDLQHLKCFAWSPDPNFGDLLAVGNTTGKIELLRLEASKVPQRNNVLTNGQGISLNVRNSRSCNSLSFCMADPNYLASGFDKARGDCSLIIWDVSTASATLSVPLNLDVNHDIEKRPPPPPRPQPAIPQLDIGRGADSRILQQHAPTETVPIISFLQQSTHQLLAGISHRWLRLFDLRSPVPSTTNVSAKVQGIATDPFDAHRIACFGEGAITVWDSRKLQLPMLSFSEKDASADGAVLRQNSVFTGIEFSSTRRGTLASLERDASYVRFWDVSDAYAQPLEESVSDGQKPRDSARTGRRSWATIPWPSTSSGHPTQNPPKDSVQMSAVLLDTRRTKGFPRPLASFALAPSTTQHPLTSNVMVVNRVGDLELYAIHDTPKTAIWSSRGDLAISAGLSCRVIEGVHESDTREDTQQQQQQHSGNSVLGLTNGTNPDSRNRSLSREDSVLRGREKVRSGPVIPPPPPLPSSLSQLPNKQVPLFGRGDEDGFPALGSNLPPARPRASDNLVNGAKKTYVDAQDQSQFMGRANAGTMSRNHSTSRARRPSGAAKGANHIVENDISMVMKRRAMAGYGLHEFKPQNNMKIVWDGDPNHDHHGTRALYDLWAWVSHSYDYFSVPKSILHGFDFAYQGLLGIWESFMPLPPPETPELVPLTAFPSYHHEQEPLDELYGNFQAALTSLAARRTLDRTWKPAVPTTKALQRQIALQLVGWSLREEELTKTIHGWEREGELSRAACWLVFLKQHAKAVSLLMKSSDESHCMLSGTIAALVPHGSRTPELRAHCERLILRLQDPYLRAMLTHLALNDWSEVLQEEALPFRERLAIALQFLDDKALTSYLRRIMNRSITQGDIDGIVVTGLSSKAGLEILQGYVDHTGDIQTAAILGSYVRPPRNVNLLKGIPSIERKVGRWVEGYRDLLDGFKMFHDRVRFDIERGQVALRERGAVTSGGVVGDWVPRQILIRCNYCNKPVVRDGGTDIGGMHQTWRPNECANCNRPLPRCSVCLMTLTIIQDAAREVEFINTSAQDTMADGIIMCQSCRHGGHIIHIIDWFYGENGSPGHDVCPVADCDCRCADEI